MTMRVRGEEKRKVWTREKGNKIEGEGEKTQKSR